MFSPMDIGILAGVALLVWGPKKFPEIDRDRGMVRYSPGNTATTWTLIGKFFANTVASLTRRNIYVYVVRHVARASLAALILVGTALVAESLRPRHLLMGSFKETLFICMPILAAFVFAAVCLKLSQTKRDDFCVEMPVQLVYWVGGILVLLIADQDKLYHAGFSAALIVAMVITLAYLMVFISRLVIQVYRMSQLHP